MRNQSSLEGLHGEQIPALIHGTVRAPTASIAGHTEEQQQLSDRVLRERLADDLSHQVDVPVCVVGPHVRPQASS